MSVIFRAVLDVRKGDTNATDWLGNCPAQSKGMKHALAVVCVQTMDDLNVSTGADRII